MDSYYREKLNEAERQISELRARLCSNGHSFVMTSSTYDKDSDVIIESYTCSECGLVNKMMVRPEVYMDRFEGHSHEAE